MDPSTGAGGAGDVRRQLGHWRGLIEEALAGALAFDAPVATTFWESMCHAVLGGGKRYRGLLVFALGVDFGVADERLLSSASAIEAIHAASLVVDDLPCMDNASRRRAAPSTHAAFGEATAILCSIALLARAQELVVRDPALAPEIKVRLGQTLADAVGGVGLCGGQFDDLFPDKVLSEAQLVDRYRRKTGALFAAALQCPAIIHGAAPGVVGRLGLAGERLGLAFQLYDDLIDLLGNAETAGKDIGQDSAKVTLAAHLGAEAAQARAEAELAAVADEIRVLCGEGYAYALVAEMSARAAGMFNGKA